ADPSRPGRDRERDLSSRRRRGRAGTAHRRSFRGFARQRRRVARRPNARPSASRARTPRPRAREPNHAKGERSMSQLNRIDHVTYACAKGTIEKWAWFHIEVEGGTLVTRVDDVRPHDPDSSMKLWCIDYGEFGIALVEGIDRGRKSQVTRFVERHGDHACQHVAFACRDLDAFRRRLLEMGGHPRGRTLVRHDGFGLVKQMFAKGYAGGDASEASF